MAFFLLEVPMVGGWSWCKPVLPLPRELRELSHRRGALDNSNQSHPKLGSRQAEGKLGITVQGYAVVPVKRSGPMYISEPHSGVASTLWRKGQTLGPSSLKPMFSNFWMHPPLACSPPYPDRPWRHSFLQHPLTLDCFSTPTPHILDKSFLGAHCVFQGLFSLP